MSASSERWMSSFFVLAWVRASASFSSLSSISIVVLIRSPHSEEITVAGNLKEMLRGIEMVGNDLTFRNSVVAPTIKIRLMTIAGH